MTLSWIFTSSSCRVGEIGLMMDVHDSLMVKAVIRMDRTYSFTRMLQFLELLNGCLSCLRFLDKSTSFSFKTVQGSIYTTFWIFYSDTEPLPSAVAWSQMDCKLSYKGFCILLHPFPETEKLWQRNLLGVSRPKVSQTKVHPADHFHFWSLILRIT